MEKEKQGRQKDKNTERQTDIQKERQTEREIPRQNKTYRKWSDFMFG